MSTSYGRPDVEDGIQRTTPPGSAHYPGAVRGGGGGGAEHGFGGYSADAHDAYRQDGRVFGADGGRRGGGGGGGGRRDDGDRGVGNQASRRSSSSSPRSVNLSSLVEDGARDAVAAGVAAGGPGGAGQGVAGGVGRRGGAGGGEGGEGGGGAGRLRQLPRLMVSVQHGNNRGSEVNVSKARRRTPSPSFSSSPASGTGSSPRASSPRAASPTPVHLSGPVSLSPNPETERRRALLMERADADAARVRGRDRELLRRMAEREVDSGGVVGSGSDPLSKGIGSGPWRRGETQMGYGDGRHSDSAMSAVVSNAYGSSAATTAEHDARATAGGGGGDRRAWSKSGSVADVRFAAAHPHTVAVRRCDAGTVRHDMQDEREAARTSQSRNDRLRFSQPSTSHRPPSGGGSDRQTASTRGREHDHGESRTAAVAHDGGASPEGNRRGAKRPRMWDDGGGRGRSLAESQVPRRSRANQDDGGTTAAGVAVVAAQHQQQQAGKYVHHQSHHPTASTGREAQHERHRLAAESMDGGRLRGDIAGRISPQPYPPPLSTNRPASPVDENRGDATTLGGGSSSSAAASAVRKTNSSRP